MEKGIAYGTKRKFAHIQLAQCSIKLISLGLILKTPVFPAGPAQHK